MSAPATLPAAPPANPQRLGYAVEAVPVAEESGAVLLRLRLVPDPARPGEPEAAALKERRRRTPLWPPLSRSEVKITPEKAQATQPPSNGG